MSLFFLLQQINIEEKIRNAPDKNYETGVLIGSLIPFVVLACIAYLMYYRAKKRNEKK